VKRTPERGSAVDDPHGRKKFCEPTVFRELGGSSYREGDFERGVASLLFFKFYDHDFNGFVADVDVFVEGSGRVGGEPVGFAGLPDFAFGGAVLLDEVHGASAEGDDDAWVFVAVEGERRVGKNFGLPDSDVFVFELKVALGFLICLLGVHDGEDSEWRHEEECGPEDLTFHDEPPRREDITGMRWGVLILREYG
jgi:hypothetical protein